MVYKGKILKLKTKTKWKNVLSLRAEIFLRFLLSNSTTHCRRKRNQTSESSEKFPNSTDKIRTHDSPSSRSDAVTTELPWGTMATTWKYGEAHFTNTYKFPAFASVPHPRYSTLYLTYKAACLQLLPRFHNLSPRMYHFLVIFGQEQLNWRLWLTWLWKIS